MLHRWHSLSHCHIRARQRHGSIIRTLALATLAGLRCSIFHTGATRLQVQSIRSSHSRGQHLRDPRLKTQATLQDEINMRTVASSAIVPTTTLNIADLGWPGPVLLVKNAAEIHPALTKSLVYHFFAICYVFDQTMLRQQILQLLKVFCLQLLPAPIHEGLVQGCRCAGLHKESLCAALVSFSNAWHALRILHKALDARQHFDAQSSCTNAEHPGHRVHHPIIWATRKRCCVAWRTEEMKAVFFIRSACPQLDSFDQAGKHLKGNCKRDQKGIRVLDLCCPFSPEMRMPPGLGPNCSLGF